MRTTLAFLFSLLLPLAAQAQGWILPCRPCPPNARCACPATPSVVRTANEVRAELIGGVVHYEVTETFVNRGPGLGEADYVFPLPNGAAFGDLKLSINGELVSGEIMNANQARQIYEDIVRSQRDPALVEWMGYGMLRARIFPINPGERKQVVVRYHMVARREGDALRIDYARGSEPVAQAGLIRPARNTREQPASGTTSFELIYPDDRAYGTPFSPTHNIVTERERRERKVITLRGDARDVTVLIPVRQRDAAAITMLPYATGNSDGFAMITLSPPPVTRRTTPRDVTIVVDVSGSMSGVKIEQARTAVKQALGTLREHDRLRVIDFSTDVRSFRDEFVLATRANVAAAQRYVDAFEAQGSTNISGALDEALRGTDTERLPLVLFITDGEPTVGDRNPESLAKRAAARRGRARVFTFGLGADVNVQLVERLAMEGRGTAQFVRPEESVERAVSVVAARLSAPVVTDVRVRATGVRLTRLLPSETLDVFAGQDLVVFARYAGSGDATLTFEGRSADGPVRWSTQFRFPERERGNVFVGRLWATQRIGYLAAEKRRHGGSRELDDEIRSLGEQFGIPTEFSSYLVVEPGMRDRMSRAPMGLSGVVTTQAVVGNAAGAPSRLQTFEAAKASAEQRAATSTAVLDSMAAPPPVVLGRGTDAAGRSSSAAAKSRRVGARVFFFTDSIWTDSRPHVNLEVVRVRPFSPAYFALLDAIPDLRAAFALGDRVKIAGHRVVIEVTPKGDAQIAAGRINTIRAAW